MPLVTMHSFVYSFGASDSCLALMLTERYVSHRQWELLIVATAPRVRCKKHVRFYTRFRRHQLIDIRLSLTYKINDWKTIYIYINYKNYKNKYYIKISQFFDPFVFPMSISTANKVKVYQYWRKRRFLLIGIVFVTELTLKTIWFIRHLNAVIFSSHITVI